MIKVLEWDKTPIQYMGQCVGNCYGSDTSDYKKNYKRGKDCIESGHGRALEYPSVTLEIDGYSIRVVRELMRHVIGTTYTQESTRYVNMRERGYVTPPAIEHHEEASVLYKNLIDKIFDIYDELIRCGINKEDAAMLLPLSMKTKIVMKINARALLHMAEVRMCSRAYWEFRQLMNDIKETISQLDSEWHEIADLMLPKCEVVGYCTEKFSCGRKPKKDVKK